MKRSSSENVNDSTCDKEIADIGDIINQKVSEMENIQNCGSSSKRHGFIDGRNGTNKLSKRQQRSMKELNAIQSLEVWEEILDENSLTADNFDLALPDNFNITLRKHSIPQTRNLSARKKSRMSSMYHSSMADITNDSWIKSKSIECLTEDRLANENKSSQLFTSYSEWDLAESYSRNIKDHNHIIDMYVKGNIINLIRGTDFHEYDQSSLIKCGRNSPKPTNGISKKTNSKYQNDFEDKEHFRPQIVDVVYKESYIKFSLNYAERERDVQQTKFWLMELEKTLNTKFCKEE